MNKNLIEKKEEMEKRERARDFCKKVKQLAESEEYQLSFFVVTEGASATSNKGCEAVKHARDCHIEWEKEHHYDPYEDWGSHMEETEYLLNNKRDA